MFLNCYFTKIRITCNVIFLVVSWQFIFNVFFIHFVFFLEQFIKFIGEPAVRKIFVCIILLSVIRYWNGNGMTFRAIMKLYGGLRYRYSLLRSGDFASELVLHNRQKTRR